MFVARINEHKFTPELREIILERDGRACRACGDVRRLCIDHIIPLSAGGPTTPDNLQVLCRPCNSRKGGGNRRRDAIGTVAIPHTLRWHRERLGWSQEYLAKIIGVDQSTVSSWECGRSRARRRLIKLAELFGTTPEDIVFNSEPSPRRSVHGGS